jgi:hypothetical protein
VQAARLEATAEALARQLAEGHDVRLRTGASRGGATRTTYDGGRVISRAREGADGTRQAGARAIVRVDVWAPRHRHRRPEAGLPPKVSPWRGRGAHTDSGAAQRRAASAESARDRREEGVMPSYLDHVT